MTQGHGDKDDCSSRKIETHQNWLARLFRVKPAMRFLCLQISGRRARQEVTILLREWRKWGMRDIEVDKERNIVFARVGQKNCESPTCPAQMKPRDRKACSNPGGSNNSLENQGGPLRSGDYHRD